jgi:hypothetical protein
LDSLANNTQWEIVFAIVAAAAITCLVGWLLDKGVVRFPERWRTDAPGQASLRVVQAAEDTARDFGEEFVNALGLAVNTAIESAWDEEAIIESIVTHLNWSPTRARWFLAVNRDQVEQTAQQMRRGAANGCPPASA